MTRQVLPSRCALPVTERIEHRKCSLTSQDFLCSSLSNLNCSQGQWTWALKIRMRQSVFKISNVLKISKPHLCSYGIKIVYTKRSAEIKTSVLIAKGYKLTRLIYIHIFKITILLIIIFNQFYYLE